VRLAAVVSALCALLVVGPATANAAPQPRTGSSVVVEPAGGTVLVQPRGSGRVRRLTKALAVPVGSVVDTTNGKVKLTSTKNRAGSELQSAVFHDGAFKVTQKTANSPVTDLELVGGDFSNCALVNRRTGVFTTARTARRSLWGSGKGRFRTRGRNGTATVRGTTWLTEDACEGTTALNRKGKVDAQSQDLAYQLDPGQSVIFSCNIDGVPGVVGLYCLAVLSQPADNIFGFGIAAQTTDDQYEMCFVEPDGTLTCGPFPFAPADGGFRAAGVGCLPAQRGTHSVYWRMRGVDLPVPLPFESTRVSPQSFCISDPPRPGIDPPARGSGVVRKARAAARTGT
jgi:hypothetical protein